MDEDFPVELAFASARIVQVRIARPTEQLVAVVAFYRDGLGLPELLRFTGHDGYDGVILGFPGNTYHLEFTQRAGGSPCPAPSAGNRLVLYIPSIAKLSGLRDRLERRGYAPVEPGNPCWLRNSVTFSDPDGWRVMLCNTTGIRPTHRNLHFNGADARRHDAVRP